MTRPDCRSCATRRNRRLSSSALSAALIGALLATSPALARPRGQRNVFQTARHLLEAAYPGLFGKGHFLEFTTGQPTDSTWQTIVGLDFTVKELSYADTSYRISGTTGERLPQRPNPTLLSGQFSFDEAGRLLEMSAGQSEVLNSNKNKVFVRLLTSLEEWTVEAASDEFVKAGGQYRLSDRQAFLARAHLDRFEAVLGRMATQAVEFKRPAEGDDSADWWVTVRSSLPDGSHPSYLMVFEPFEGKLTYLRMEGAIVIHAARP